MSPWKFSALNICGVALFTAGWLAGWIPGLIASDKSYLTILILFGVALSLVFLSSGKDWAAWWVGDKLVTVGLIGTVVGMILGLSGVEAQLGAETNIVAVRQVITGLLTAMSTTLFGLVGWLWVELNLAVCRETNE
jgi:hypothetical protein